MIKAHQCTQSSDKTFAELYQKFRWNSARMRKLERDCSFGGSRSASSVKSWTSRYPPWEEHGTSRGCGATSNIGCNSLGTVPSFSLFFGFHSLANRLLTLTDFMGCCQSYISQRLLQGEMNGNHMCHTGHIWPRRGENLSNATCLSIQWGRQDVKKRLR